MEKILRCETSYIVKRIKRKYPWIPKWVIRRVLYASYVAQYEIGNIEYEPSLDDWK